MERQAEQNDCRRSLWAALLVVGLLAGCEERPAYVLDPDRSVSPYPIEHRTFTITVRDGDSVSKIADRCDTTSAVIRRMNDLDDSRPIYPGEVLRVPSPPHEVVADVPRPMPRPHFASVARYDGPRAVPRPRPGRADAPPPPKEDVADHGDQQSWWSWWSKPSDETATDSGSAKFIWPVQGHIIQGFGHGGRGERNDEINIATADGTPIRAAASGTVTYTGNELKGYGNLVLIRHSGGFVTAYAHAGSVRVSRGDVVEKGQIIGTTGETGDVDRPQLHFEIRRGTQAVDPERYLATDRAS